jgi:hypothetical protein
MRKKHTHQRNYLSGKWVFIALTILIGAGCSKKNNMNPEQSWVRVYDHPDYNLVFYPLGMTELSDNSFVVLSGNKYDTINYAWPQPYLLGVDKLGETQWTLKVEAPYVSPVPNIISQGNSLYFFCMDQVTLGTHLLLINTSGVAPSLFKSFPDLTYPLHASQMADGHVLLTSYDKLTRSTVVTCFDASFGILWSKKYSVIEDAEEKVIYHLTYRKQIFPFFAGETPAGQSPYYFVNSFYNYSFSLLFLNATTGDQAGLVNGFRYDAAASAVIFRKDNNYMLTWYNEAKNFINTSAQFSFTSIQNIDALGGINWAEIAAGSMVKTLHTTINGKQTEIIAAETKDNQVLLLFFDIETGTILTSKYLGSTYPVKLATVIATSEGGIAVLVQTQVAGRFARIELFKIPPEDISI